MNSRMIPFEFAYEGVLKSKEVKWFDCSPRWFGHLDFLKIRHSLGGVYVHSFRIGINEMILQPEEYKAELFSERALVYRTMGLDHIFPTPNMNPTIRASIGLVNDASWPVGLRFQWQWLEKARFPPIAIGRY